MTTKPSFQPEGPRVEAALVYRDDRGWVVGAPPNEPAGEEAFSGPNARRDALEFAYRRYGSARFFAN
ncbi:MAG: hypothetical protein RQ966_13390 [Acetobacteraceae bacterium]|nr:hypothetical protein [Acetobacteraceae bacterium]